MFTDIINITQDIITNQNVIKEETESLQDLNKSLQIKSLELKQVLASSQAQLQTDISIPIDLINQLAAAVRQLKEEQQKRFSHLLNSLSEAHDQFEQQELILEKNIQENEKKLDKENSSNDAWKICNGSSNNSSEDYLSMSNCHANTHDSDDVMVNDLSCEEEEKKSLCQTEYSEENFVEDPNEDSTTVKIEEENTSDKSAEINNNSKTK